MSLTKLCKCKDKDNCTDEWWFRERRARVATPKKGEMAPWTHHFDKSKGCGRILVRLEEYFPQLKLRGRGVKKQAERAHKLFLKQIDETGEFWTWWRDRHGKSVAQDRPLTVRQLKDRYVRDHLQAEGKYAEKPLLDMLESMVTEVVKLKDPDGDDIQWEKCDTATMIRWVQALKGRRTRSGVRSGYYVFLAVFNWAVEAEIIDRVPWNTVKLSKKHVPRRSTISHRERRLFPGELEKLRGTWTNSSGRVYPVMGRVLTMLMDVIFACGFRRNTLRLLQFKDFTPDWKEINVPAHKMKGKRPSHKFTTSRVREILAQQRERFVALGCYSLETYVFGYDGLDQLRNVRGRKLGEARSRNSFGTHDFVNACKRAGIPVGKKDPNGLHLHDVRAEAACQLFEECKDIREVMHFLDHVSLEETQVYIDRLMKGAEAQRHVLLEDLERKRQELVPTHLERRAEPLSRKRKAKVLVPNFETKSA